MYRRWFSWSFVGGLRTEGEAGGAVVQRAFPDHIYICVKSEGSRIRELKRKMKSCDEGVIIVVKGLKASLSPA